MIDLGRFSQTQLIEASMGGFNSCNPRLALDQELYDWHVGKIRAIRLASDAFELWITIST